MTKLNKRHVWTGIQLGSMLLITVALIAFLASDYEILSDISKSPEYHTHVGKCPRCGYIINARLQHGPGRLHLLPHLGCPNDMTPLYWMPGNNDNNTK
jgi:hypothetical protein